jgi:hypothetical protein
MYAVFTFYDVPNKQVQMKGKFTLNPVELQVSETSAGSGIAVKT